MDSHVKRYHVVLGGRAVQRNTEEDQMEDSGAGTESHWLEVARGPAVYSRQSALNVADSQTVGR